MNTPRPARQVHTALFVDFDNIFLGLESQDLDAAQAFATNPDRWLSWLEHELPLPGLDGVLSARRSLIRRCYLNPQTFGHYRPYFIRSAFEVIDCPPLTRMGKTSTDIYMVMDILDALNTPTYIDEFIILSSDADFTPVLLRLRKHARYSAVLSVGYVSPAYKVATDFLIDQETFIYRALGISEAEFDDDDAMRPAVTDRATAVLMSRIAERLSQAAGEEPDGIQASELPAVYKEFPEFRQSSHWLGFFSLRNLTEALVGLRNDLIILEEDPWCVMRITPVPADEGRDYDTNGATLTDLREQIAELIHQRVKASPTPVVMAVLAWAVQERFGRQLATTDWLGAGSFKDLLLQLDLGDLQISTITPGRVYDPSRHIPPGEERIGVATAEAFSSIPAADRPDPFLAAYPEMAPLARKISQFTDTPYLSPEHYALLLDELAREINERGYQITRTSKTVRDRCVEKGAPVARAHVNFVLHGIRLAGHTYSQEGGEDVLTLGRTLTQNVFNLCRSAQLELSEEEQGHVRRWITGRLAGVEDPLPPIPTGQVVAGPPLEHETQEENGAEQLEASPPAQPPQEEGENP